MDIRYQERLRTPPQSPVKGQRAIQPGASPSKRKLEFQQWKPSYSERHIPAYSSQEMQDSYIRISQFPTESTEKRDPTEATNRATYHQVLQNELWKEPQPLPENGSAWTPPVSSPSSLLSYVRTPKVIDDSLYSLSALGARSQAVLTSQKQPPRKIPKIPFKVLEAPNIQDDFYLNLVDWSSQNILAVGLDQSVYTWNATTNLVSCLCELPGETLVTSVAWMGRGSHIAVGATDGSVSLWDITKQTKIRNFTGHNVRTGALAWSQSPRWLLSSGSRDRTIIHRDVRSSANSVAKSIAHKQEVCGLKWGLNPTSLLASGGNDNKLFLWEQRMLQTITETTSYRPLRQFSAHKAAVKAIAWSPHQRGLLASGGGTADQCIRFWNAVSATDDQAELNHINTGSQICNLAWSKNVNEIVSTHGYSQNQISVWQYPSMNQVATLTGHSMRVLYLAVSPDGQTIVTGAGDQTLRFWSVFPKAKAPPGVHAFQTTQPTYEIR